MKAEVQLSAGGLEQVFEAGGDLVGHGDRLSDGPADQLGHALEDLDRRDQVILALEGEERGLDLHHAAAEREQIRGRIALEHARSEALRG